jgi:hypothetical protein
MYDPLEELTKLRKRISVSKGAKQKFVLEIHDLKKFNDINIKEKYQVEISNRFVALENIDESLHNNSSWETIRDNTKNSAKENLVHHRLKHNKPWFDVECSKVIDQRKQAKLQWLQNPSQISGDDLQNLRHETTRALLTYLLTYSMVQDIV